MISSPRVGGGQKRLSDQGKRHEVKQLQVGIGPATQIWLVSLLKSGENRPRGYRSATQILNLQRDFG